MWMQKVGIMIRKFFAVSLVAAAAFPSTVLAGTSSPNAHANASRQCTAVRAKIGRPSFNRAFASFSACVSTLTPLARQNATTAMVVTAAAACRGKRHFAACVALNVHAALELSSAPSSQTPQQQPPSGSTVTTGCGSETAGLPHPMGAAGCTAAKSS